MTQDARPPADAGTPLPTSKTPTAAESVRRHLVEHGRTQAYIYVAALARITVDIALMRLDHGDARNIADAREELVGLLEATRVLDEPLDEAQLKLDEAANCPACGLPATETDQLVETTSGHRVHRRHTESAASGYFGSAVAL